MNPPCHNCPDRKVGCHDACPRYLGWKREHDAKREAERQRNLVSVWLSTPNGRRR